MPAIFGQCHRPENDFQDGFVFKGLTDDEVGSEPRGCFSNLRQRVISQCGALPFPVQTDNFEAEQYFDSKSNTCFPACKAMQEWQESSQGIPGLGRPILGCNTECANPPRTAGRIVGPKIEIEAALPHVTTRLFRWIVEYVEQRIEAGFRVRASVAKAGGKPLE